MKLLLGGIVVLTGCACSAKSGIRGDGGTGDDADAGDGGEVDAGDSGADASPDAGPPPMASGGCTEHVTVEEDVAERAQGELTTTPDGFLVVYPEHGRTGCALRERDADGALLSEVTVDGGTRGLCYYHPFVSTDRRLLFVGDAVWAGTMEGDGGWAGWEWPVGPVLSEVPGIQAEESVVVWHNELFRIGFDGTIQQQSGVFPADLYEVHEFAYAQPVFSWSGSVLGVAWAEDTTDGGGGLGWGTDRVYFQRFDIDFAPLDPDPILVVELTWDDLQTLAEDPLELAWDGEEFGLFVVWTDGRGDFGESRLTDVFRFGETDPSLGSFELDRGGPGQYVGDGVERVIEAPDRVVAAYSAEYWDESGEEVWSGNLLAPLDLSTGERRGEDARLSFAYASRPIPTVRHGNRLAGLWEEREYIWGGPADQDAEWRDHLNLTIFDCAALLGAK